SSFPVPGISVRARVTHRRDPAQRWVLLDPSMARDPSHDRRRSDRARLAARSLPRAGPAQLPSTSFLAIRSYGFCDASEIIVFAFGYTAGLVYGPMMRERGFVVAAANILRRAWQVYVAHVFLCVFYIAEIAYVSRRFDNPLFAEDTNIFEFLHRPDMTLVEGLLLNFKPGDIDVLPLYILLLIAFVPVLWLLLPMAIVA